MSQMIGADIAALRTLAAQFDSSAQRLRHQAGAVSSRIQISAWVGPVAVLFKHSWASEHSVRLRHAADSLEQAARSLRQNAAEQEAASASLAGGAGAAVVAKAFPSGPDAVRPYDLFDAYRDFDNFTFGGVVPPKAWAEFGAKIADLSHVPGAGALDKMFTGMNVITAIKDGDWLAVGGEGTKAVGDVIQSKGGVVGYLTGTNVKLYTDVVLQARKIDIAYVPETFSYMREHPWDAAKAGFEENVKFFPTLISNFIPGRKP